tara:strand:- start:5719 stop:6873 length:1155 start_codon:yes stop_codon:yes gene_type:complete
VRSINNRYYFDYNATSPLAESVKSWLSKGDFPFANPSSIHHSGKTARRAMNDVQNYFFSTFSLDSNSHDLFFHSGATEGIGNLIRGFFEKNPSAIFVYASTDHSCVHGHAQRLIKMGVEVVELSVDKNGAVDLSQIDRFKNTDTSIFVNWTWVNNETGVVWPLEQALGLKKSLKNCVVHVDAVQAPGKIADWKQLSSELDAYTFSAHKFGSLKGVGFTFVSPNVDACSVILGGGQQNGRRSGTENTYGVYSSMLALKELEELYDCSKSAENLKVIMDQVSSTLANAGEVVAAKAIHRNTNTIYLVFYGAKSDITSVAFDLAGMDVSTGSACSSGAIVPSRVLMAMGYDELQAKSAIRLSFAPKFTKAQAKEYADKISAIVKRFT